MRKARSIAAMWALSATPGLAPTPPATGSSLTPPATGWSPTRPRSFASRPISTEAQTSKSDVLSRQFAACYKANRRAPRAASVLLLLPVRPAYIF